jgi:hypothetical protein
MTIQLQEAFSIPNKQEQKEPSHVKNLSMQNKKILKPAKKFQVTYLGKDIRIITAILIETLEVKMV